MFLGVPAGTALCFVSEDGTPLERPVACLTTRVVASGHEWASGDTPSQ